MLILKMSVTFKSSNFLNQSSVWALYLIPARMRIALFCSFTVFPRLAPQQRMEYCSRGNISELYRSLSIDWGKTRFNLFIMPNDLEILFAILWVCSFQVMFSSNISPKKLNFDTLSICKSCIFNSVIKGDIFH